MTSIVPIPPAEQTEIAAYADFAAGAPEPVRAALGISSLRIGSVQALVIREDPSRFFNRAGGFGLVDPAAADVAAVCGFYRAQGVASGMVLIAPSQLPEDWAAIAVRNDLTEGGRFAKLGCDVKTALAAPDGAAQLDPALRVGLVEPHQAREWATVMMSTFGFTAPGMVEVAEACVGRPDWRQYAVWENDRIVAVGSVYLNGECADMFGAVTLPEARGRGAQSALLTARAQAAEAEGCRWLVAETGAETPGSHNTSLHNMRRAGFEVLYERATWLWRA